MATGNGFTISCTVIAGIGTVFAFMLLIRMIQIKVATEVDTTMYWSAFATVCFYTAVITLNFTSFVIHIANNTTIQHHENHVIYVLIDGAYGFCYIYSMVSMLIVFLLRVLYTHENSMYELPKDFARKMWILIIVISLLGTGGSICDVIATRLAKVLLYVIAGVYILGLFAVSSYLLYLFVSKLKRMHEQYTSFEMTESEEAEEFYHVIVRITIIAGTAILSTFVLTILGSVVDMVSLFGVASGAIIDDLEYLTRTFFVIDSIIGAFCMFLTLAPNKHLYEKLCHRCERKYFIRNQQPPMKDHISDDTATATGTVANATESNIEI